MLPPRGSSFVALVVSLTTPTFADPLPPDSAPVPAPAPAAPAPAAPAPAAPAPTSEPSPPEPSPPATAAAAAAAPSPPPAPRHDLARVHLAANYPGAVLELRSYVDFGDWKAVCGVPCDRELSTLGAEARVSAPGMTTSNVFRIDPGPGTALIKVNGGSATARTFGILGLGIGIPLGLAGTAMYSYGTYSDDDGLALAGGLVLGTGAAMILAAIPLLLTGTTNVRDGKGQLIATAPAEPSTF